jgi:cell division protein FtsX
MSSQLDRLESKMDKTIDVITETSIVVAKLEVYVEKNTEDLAEHIEGVQQTRVRLERLEKIEQWSRGAIWIAIGIGTLVLAIVKLKVYNAN